MLDKLQEWRLEGGPKLGVVTDFDERLSTILDNLDMAHYFDVVVSTRLGSALGFGAGHRGRTTVTRSDVILMPDP